MQSSPTPICWDSDVKIWSRFKCPNTSADSDSNEGARQNAAATGFNYSKPDTESLPEIRIEQIAPLVYRSQGQD